MKKITIILIGLFLVSSIFAQPRSRRNPQNNCRPDRMIMDRGERGENRGQMMAFKLTERLYLSTDQAEKFFPRMKEHREIMDKIDNELFDAREEIRDKMIDKKDISDAELKKVISKVDGLKNNRKIERDKFLNSLDNVLDNTQIAKLAFAPLHHKNDRMMKESKRPRKRR